MIVSRHEQASWQCMPLAEAPMKLKPLHSLASVKLVGRVRGDRHVDLTAYVEYYGDVPSGAAFRSPVQCGGSPQHD